MTDALASLPRLSFRGIVVPVTGGRDAGFSHEDVAHKFIYRDNEFLEALGARGWTFSYTIPMRQDIARGPYSNLYTEVLPRFIAACRDTEPGELVDPELSPIYGSFRVKPTSLTSQLDVNKRDGTDIRVEFVHAPEFDDLDSDVDGAQSIADLATQAGLLDGEVLVVDWEQEVPPEPSLDPLTAIDSIGRQLDRNVNKVSAKFDDAAFRLEKIEKTFDRLENPQTWGVRRSTRRLRSAVIRSKQRADDPLKRIVTVAQRFNTTATAIALEHGMTLQELLRLNPGIAATPIVLAGTTIRKLV